MLFKTRGIVISFVKFKETSIITKIYTEAFGLQTYIENGVRSAKGKNRIALFQPLTLLDLVIYHDPKKEINRISEIKCNNPYHSIPFEIKKSSIGIFINEILIKCLKEHHENLPLFAFLTSALQYLDNQRENIENFHLQFLISLSSYLGFGPKDATEILDQIYALAIGYQEDPGIKDCLDKIIALDFGSKIEISRNQRQKLLEIILVFYKIHLEDFTEIKALSVLKMVLD